METKGEVLLKRMNIMYQNIYSLLTAFQQASTDSDSIEVTLLNEDGTTTTVTVNSFQELQQEINRIDNNFKSLTTSPSYILDSDGTISSYQKTTFMNAEYLENFTLDGSNCVVDNTSLIEDLVYPTVKLPITLNDDIIKTDIYCKVYDVTEGFENIPNEPKQINLEYLQTTGDIYCDEYERKLEIEKQQVQYFGKFTIENVSVGDTSNEFIITTDTVKYESKYNLGSNIDLKIGDFLVMNTGNTKFQISDINKFAKQITILRVGGIEAPKVGIEQLYFNEVIKSEVNQVYIPIKPEKKLVVFLSTQNLNTISYPSVGIKIDTTDYELTYNDTTYTIDEYFQKYVTNFSSYLSSLMDNTTIPYNLGIIPNTPELLSQNFKVIQINKHLIDAKTQSEMDELNKKKDQTQNEIDYKQTVINQTQNEVDTLKFDSVEEKNYRLDKIVSLRTEINTLKQNLLNITRDIDSNAVKYGLKNNKPKFKVIGFWDMQEALYSPLTAAQNIIKYEVQYRYLSKDVDTTDSTTYKMVSNGKEVTVAFSNWIEFQTRTLNKTRNINGDMVWETPLLDSVEDININQCSISISEGESIEIKVRAVTEAGYPVSPIKSGWSDALRINFPDNLKTNTLQASVTQNNTDLNKAEFNAILQNQGLLNHVAGTIKESEKTFFHSAADIASGQYTNEQKNIPLDTIIKNIMNDISVLKEEDSASNIVVSFVDFDNEDYVITNNTTIDVSAGNYSKTFDILDKTTWGGIVRKRGYVKIRNNNNVPIELRTLVPGVNIDSTNAENYYNVPIINGDTVQQSAKQILYFRNVDLVGQVRGGDTTFRLVVPKSATDNTYPNSTYIDGSVTDKDKDLIQYNPGTNTVSIYKLIANPSAMNFLGFTTEHPDYDYDNKEAMIDDFKRLAKFSPNLKALQYQSETDVTGDEDFVGFKDNDLYAIGRYSCGAWLYPYITKPTSIQVVGNTTMATMAINKESEVLIPIIFEYRMVDRLGNINGELNFDINTGLEYNKKLGIDLLINNSLFKFDVNVTAKYKSKISTIDTKNVSSISGAYNNENKENLY